MNYSRNHPTVPPPPSAGVAAVAVFIALAAIAGISWLVKPSAFPGASRRAAASTQTTHELVAAKDAPAAANAASAAVINRALSDVPASPATSFIKNEIPIMLARSPQPDPAELLNAERRRVAFMEGRLSEQQSLTERALKDAAALTLRAAKAEAAKEASDLALEQAAAAEHARTMQALGAGFIALLALGLWAYSKLYGISPASLGRMAADIRAGGNPIEALSVHTAPWLHATVQKYAKLAATLPDHVPSQGNRPTADVIPFTQNPA